MNFCHLVFLLLASIVGFGSGFTLQITKVPSSSLECRYVRKNDGGSTLGVWPGRKFENTHKLNFTTDIPSNLGKPFKIIQEGTGLVLVYVANSEQASTPDPFQEPRGLVLMRPEAIVNAPVGFNFDKWRFANNSLVGRVLNVVNGKYTNGTKLQHGAWIATPGLCDRGGKCDGYSITTLAKGQAYSKAAVPVYIGISEGDRCEPN